MQNDIFIETKIGTEFTVNLVPGAKTEQIVGIVDVAGSKAVKIAIREKPAENKANIALIEFLAKTIGVAKSRIMIKWGHKARIKRIVISDMPSEKISKTLTPR